MLLALLFLVQAGVDSVAVSPTVTASQGTVSGTTYKAPATPAGASARIVATLAGAKPDTAEIAWIAADVVIGVPFGWTGLQAAGYRAPFTLSLDPYDAGTIVGKLSAARTAKQHLLLALMGGDHSNYLSVISGSLRFDPKKWTAKLQTFNAAAIRAAMAQAVADGTVIGTSVMDEPHVSGSGDGNTWGPVGEMTKLRVDGLCGQVHTVFPTLPAGPVHDHAAFEPTKGYKVCDFFVDEYSARKGDVVAFRDAGLAMAARDHHAILESMNVLNGGTQDKDGTWTCPGSGLGTLSPNCQMTPAQITAFGRVLGVAGCGMVMWKWDDSFAGKAANVTALNAVATTLRGIRAVPCTRH